MKLRKPELLAPAGDLEKLKAAVLYGADAVYLGGKDYNLRKQATNFTLGEIKEALYFAKKRGVKVYVALNIFAHNKDLKGISSHLKKLASLPIDGLIVADVGVLELVRKNYPHLPIHLSTQANVTNTEAALFYQKQGVKRITLARELSLKELKEITQNVDIETEIFIHGAMCISYSGRCLLSKYLVNRDGNLGDCAQACRWNYYLMEEKRPGEYHPVLEKERGTYFFNSKDLCLIKHLPKLVEVGMSSFKIEGRAKSTYYVAAVTAVYRQALDSYLSNPKTYKYNPTWTEELEKVSHRGYTSGFVIKEASKEGETEQTETSFYKRTYDFVGLVEGYDKDTGQARIVVKNQFARGDELEVLRPKKTALKLKVEEIRQPSGDKISQVHPNYLVEVPSDIELPRYTIIRKARIG